MTHSSQWQSANHSIDIVLRAYLCLVYYVAYCRRRHRRRNERQLISPSMIPCVMYAKEFLQITLHSSFNTHCDWSVSDINAIEMRVELVVHFNCFVIFWLFPMYLLHHIDQYIIKTSSMGTSMAWLSEINWLFSSMGHEPRATTTSTFCAHILFQERNVFSGRKIMI